MIKDVAVGECFRLRWLRRQQGGEQFPLRIVERQRNIASTHEADIPVGPQRKRQRRDVDAELGAGIR